MFSLCADYRNLWRGKAESRQEAAFYSMNFEHLGVIESSLDGLKPEKEADWTNYPKGSYVGI